MKINIHNIYAKIFQIWRVKRMEIFVDKIGPDSNDLILDVGGYPRNWTKAMILAKQIDCVNVDAVSRTSESSENFLITSDKGDGCDLKYPDKSYEILFSNSVIEHVGDWEKQCAFALEARRVGKKLWIQTPAMECPLEPHYLAPFVHWLPVSIRRRVLRWFTPWGWITKPTQEKIDSVIYHTQLLTKKEMIQLFPDCKIITERLLWVIPKSYVAFRL